MMPRLASAFLTQLALFSFLSALAASFVFTALFQPLGTQINSQTLKAAAALADKPTSLRVSSGNRAAQPQDVSLER
jgi:hypothetical protein